MGTPWLSRSVMPATRSEWPDSSGGSPTSRIRRLSIRYTSLVVRAVLVSRFSLRTAVRKRGAVLGGIA